MKYILSFFVFLGLLSCNASKVAKYHTIEYEVGPCFGFCPVYKITIDADRNAILEAEHFNFYEGQSRADFSKPREGTFKSTISTDDYAKLITLIDNANIKSLQDSYIDKRIMDASKSDLRISFPDGTKKEIKISAGEKPEELVAVYSYIETIKKNQNWEKIK